MEEDKFDQNFSSERTVVLIPSITLGLLMRGSFHGLRFYEERYLYFLNFLKQPKTKLVAVLSSGFEPTLINYFIKHVARANNLSESEIKSRFKTIKIKTKKNETLTECLLKSKRYIKVIKDNVKNHPNTYIEFWRETEKELQLAKKLSLPYFGLGKKDFYINYKTGARKIFKESNVKQPVGIGNIKDIKDAYLKLQKLKSKTKVEEFLIKLNDEGSGRGIIKIPRRSIDLNYTEFRKNLIKFVPDPIKKFEKCFKLEKGVVEEFIKKPIVASPSAQFIIKKDGTIINYATHDQILSGTDYLGVQFPANKEYRNLILTEGYKIAQKISNSGGSGYLAIDFLVTKDNITDPWQVYAIEINARKGGSNHPYMWIKYLTQAKYNKKLGTLNTSQGEIIYKATEQFVCDKKFKMIKPALLLKKLEEDGLDFDHQQKKGVFIYLLSPLEKFGKIGLVIAGYSEKEVNEYWEKTKKLFDRLLV